MKINSEDTTAEIQKLKPNLKINSITQYETHLKKLKKIFDSDTFDFLSKPDDVMDKLSERHYTSQRNTLNAVIILLMALNHDEKYNELIEEYQKLRDQRNAQYVEDQQSGKISEKQSANFVELKEVAKMMDEMAKEIKPLKHKTSLSGKEHELVTVYTMFNILTRIPLRNDLSGMKIITKANYKKLSDDDKKSTNYLVNEKTSMFFVLNEYKTSKKYGEKKIDIPKDLEKIIRAYLKITGTKKGDDLFVNSQGNSITRNGISQMLLKTSKSRMGKNISTTMLRKIVASHHFGPDTEFGKLKEKQEELADAMGHSVAVQNQTYIKEK